MKASYIASHLC